MIIEKKQKDKNNCVFNWSYFDSAREGFKHILKTKEPKGKKILVPAYIGYSSREGSGVFDPIREAKIRYIFYNMDAALNIDMESLKEKIRANRNNVLLIIHYFGFIDKNIRAVKQYAKANNMMIIEDFAQAFFTFWMNPVIDFDYGIFSMHKLFPVSSGGMVISRGKMRNSHKIGYDLFNYNIKEIVQKRIENYNTILDRLEKKAGLYGVTLFKRRLDGAVPHSFPILLRDKEIRDRLYFQLNKEGYGVVSLYHTLISEADGSFMVEHEVSNRILNLPVHQDAGKDGLGRMLDRMFALIRKPI